MTLTGTRGQILRVGARQALGFENDTFLDDSPSLQGFSLQKYGVVLSPSYLPGGTATPGTFDEAMVEGVSVHFNPDLQLWIAAYVGYDGAMSSSGFPASGSRGRLGIAASWNLREWLKLGGGANPGGPFFGPTGSGSDPDGGTITGPLLIPPDDPRVSDGKYHLFYIGMPHTGYEGADGPVAFGVASTPSICHATANTWAAILAGTWTRHGTVVASSRAGSGPTSWRAGAVWRPNVVLHEGQLMMFFNATDASGTEAIGYATFASDINSALTVQDADCPIWTSNMAVGSSFSIADPFVYRRGNIMWMAYTGIAGGGFKADNLIWTTVDEFPLGWRKHAFSTVLRSGAPWDDQLCGKPFPVFANEELYWFHVVAHGTGAARTWEVALAIEGGAEREVTRKVGAVNQPAFGTNLTNLGGFRNVGFSRDATGRVRLEGTIKATGVVAPFAALFTLPRGYAPAEQELFIVAKNGVEAVAKITVTVTGVVALFSAALANNDNLILDGVEWDLGV